ncbi:MAG: hypothetical protein ACREQ8_07775 [Woeseiaceae bacterium]
MNGPLHLLAGLVLCSPLAALDPGDALTLLATAASTGGVATTIEERNGQHDFDFSIGTWRTEVSLLQDPLTGSTKWVDYEGTSVVRKVGDGRANLVELDVAGPAGRIEGLSLRLYNPQSRQWSLNYASSASGTLTPPVFGEFRNGRGEFFGRDTLNGRAIFVKFVISNVTPDSWRFEQSFSDDGGRTWEVNWIAIDTLVEEDEDGE